MIGTTPAPHKSPAQGTDFHLGCWRTMSALSARGLTVSYVVPGDVAPDPALLVQCHICSDAWTLSARDRSHVPAVRRSLLLLALGQARRAQ